ncbi:MAG: hypothetical protein DMD92_03280 [Candidatus Rokuibacteriota bacterium]|nr:MAG: hypothetical protein DMD92_03280 [Candidatus Rokubacteria bacterium]
MKFETAPPRGMRDLLPREVELRDRAAATILATYTTHGFRRIETPALESLGLLLGSEGGENEKLVFKVLKRGAKLESVTSHREDDLADLGLRFDLTVSCQTRSRPSRSARCGAPSGPRRAGSGSSPSATSTSWGSRPRSRRSSSSLRPPRRSWHSASSARRSA